MDTITRITNWIERNKKPYTEPKKKPLTYYNCEYSSLGWTNPAQTTKHTINHLEKCLHFKKIIIENNIKPGYRKESNYSKNKEIIDYFKNENFSECKHKEEVIF